MLSKINIGKKYMVRRFFEHIITLKNLCQNSMEVLVWSMCSAQSTNLKGWKWTMSDFLMTSIRRRPFYIDPNTFKGKEKMKWICSMLLWQGQEVSDHELCPISSLQAEIQGKISMRLTMAPECIVECIRCEEKAPSMSRLCSFWTWSKLEHSLRGRRDTCVLDVQFGS